MVRMGSVDVFEHRKKEFDAQVRRKIEKKMCFHFVFYFEEERNRHKTKQNRQLTLRF